MEREAQGSAKQQNRNKIEIEIKPINKNTE
jgi:hypothetical protein